MVVRFSKRVRLMKGVTLNLNKGSTSVRFGAGPVGTTIGTKGAHVSGSLPGTGHSVRHKIKTETEAIPARAYVPAASRSTTSTVLWWILGACVFGLLLMFLI